MVERHHLVNFKGFKSSVPGKGTKTKHVFLTISYNITIPSLDIYLQRYIYICGYIYKDWTSILYS